MRFNGIKALVGLVLAMVTGAAHAAPLPPLMAGAGKANIDPPAAMLPIHNNPGDPYLATIHDSLFARAVVVDGRGGRVIIVAADMIMMPDAVYDRIVARLAKAYGVAPDHIMLAATHCHTVPWTIDAGYEQVVSDGITAAVAQAAAHEVPVSIGQGEGHAFININRDEKTAHGFILGQDPDGPSDKTVRVIGFFRKDHTPVAILTNYAVHAVTLHSAFTAGGDQGFVSADIPGVVDAFVDAHYGAETTTLWTSGAAADQNPILMAYYAEPDAQGTASSNDLSTSGFEITRRLGQDLALEIIRVTDTIKPLASSKIDAAQTVIACPTKADPAVTKPLRIGHIGLGPIDIVSVSGEVGTVVDQHLRQKTGRDPMLLTLTNGYGGYLPDDASYDRGDTFEVGKTLMARGCEPRIVAAAAKWLGGHP